MNRTDPPIVLIVGRSDAGKTTLIEKLLPRLTALGLRVGTVKHDVHGFSIDHPGKDSYRHKAAGAVQTILSSPQKLAMVRDTDHDHTLEELLPLFNGVDLILTEGYKREARPKVEIFRPEVYADPLCREDDNLVALVSDASVDLGVPRFGLEDLDGLAGFLKQRFVSGQAGD
jgi:molybdopterin-guanine dinucleotide biosynthesis protein B